MFARAHDGTLVNLTLSTQIRIYAPYTLDERLGRYCVAAEHPDPTTRSYLAFTDTREEAEAILNDLADWLTKRGQLYAL